MKHWNSSGLTTFACSWIFNVIRMVKRNLSFSYRPRAVYENVLNVRYSMMFWMRRAVTGDLSDRAIDRSNTWRNWRNDVWYMMLTTLISTMRKYNTEPQVATTNQHYFKLSNHIMIMSLMEHTRSGTATDIPYCTRKSALQYVKQLLAKHAEANFRSLIYVRQSIKH